MGTWCKSLKLQQSSPPKEKNTLRPQPLSKLYCTVVQEISELWEASKGFTAERTTSWRHGQNIYLGPTWRHGILFAMHRLGHGEPSAASSPEAIFQWRYIFRYCSILWWQIDHAIALQRSDKGDEIRHHEMTLHSVGLAMKPDAYLVTTWSPPQFHAQLRSEL